MEAYPSKDDLLDDLYEIGQKKPMGYLPIETLEQICCKNIAELTNELIEQDLHVRRFNDGECLRRGGALYAYHAQALEHLLQTNQSILLAHQWPLEIHGFVEAAATIRAQVRTELFDLIADAFGDYTNSNRKNTPL